MIGLGLVLDQAAACGRGQPGGGARGRRGHGKRKGQKEEALGFL